jgi:hypothetical protein
VEKALAGKIAAMRGFYFLKSSAKTPTRARIARRYAQAGGEEGTNFGGAGFPVLGLGSAGLPAV